MSDETQKTEDQKDPTPPAADKEQAPTEGVKPEAKAEKTFTQEDLDLQIKNRLAREKEKQETLEQQLKELNEFREKVETEKKQREEELAAKELERAKEKGEFEKVLKLTEEQYNAKTKAEAERVATIAAERDAMRAELEKTKIDNALYAEAAKLAVDPGDVVQLIKSGHSITLDPKTHTISVDGDSTTSLEHIVRAFLDKKPHLAKSDYAGKSGAGSSAAKAPSGGKVTYTREQIRDPDFYKAHEDDILLAGMEGRISQ
jgi:hypothetical protein